MANIIIIIIIKGIYIAQVRKGHKCAIGRYPDALLATPKYYYVASEIMVISNEFRCHKRVVGLPPAYF